MTISWELTNDLSMVSASEFDKDWCGIYGSFELRIDDSSVGFVLGRTLSENEGL